MSRTTPDPVLAAAALDELTRRVRSSRRSPFAASVPSRSRHRWGMEVGAAVGVLVLVGGVAIGVAGLRPSFDTGGGLSGSITRTTTASPTADAGPTASATPTPTGTATPTSGAPITDPPTSTAPPATQPPTTPPPMTPTTPTTPTTTAPAGLVGPAGATQRTSADIRTWALSLGFGEIWAEQAVLDTTCMAEHGFLYDPEFARDGGNQRTGMTDAEYTAYQAALYGPPTDAPYDWRTAGCHGRSVHVTGQDANH